jgi:hypothetical protein
MEQIYLCFEAEDGDYFLMSPHKGFIDCIKVNGRQAMKQARVFASEDEARGYARALLDLYGEEWNVRVTRPQQQR